MAYMDRRGFLAAAGAAGAMIAAPAFAQPSTAGLLPIFDAHLHYNWEPRPYLTMDEVLALFKRNNVTGIIATSRPNDGTHALVARRPEGVRVIPFIRPYRVRADIASWFNDPSIYDLVVAEYARGYYVGIGEFHISGKAAASDWVRRTVDFAVEKNLYLHAHADEEAVEILIGHSSKVRIIWAHTGFSLPTARVARLLEKHAALWGELSYRGGVTDGAGKVAPEWRDLFTRFPDRFVLGSDTWINERWATYSDIMAGYRAWLADLPPDLAARIAHRNAEALFPAG